MPGPAPKPPEQRRNRHAPERGEWIDIWAPRLEQAAHPALSTLSKDSWKASTRRLWDAWRFDPASTYWAEADLAYALETLSIYETEEKLPWAELARRWDKLGLTPKGKRDLRYRIRFAPWEEPGLEPAPVEPDAAGGAERDADQLASRQPDGVTPRAGPAAGQLPDARLAGQRVDRGVLGSRPW